MLSAIRREVGIDPEDWDAIVVADGSGQDIGRPCGWGALLYRRDQPTPKPLWGGLSAGTNIMAEVYAVLQPLSWLVYERRGVKQGGFHVHVVSDSLYTVGLLNDLTPARISDLHIHSDLWLAILGAKRRGLRITAHHTPRNELAAHKLAHNLANLARKSQIKMLKGLSQEDLGCIFLPEEEELPLQEKG